VSTPTWLPPAALRRRLPAVAVLLAAAVLLVLPAGARGAGTITGTVTSLSTGSPIGGAVVTAAGPGQPPVSDTTGDSGTFSIAVGGGGPYGLAVQATGFGAQSVPGVQSGALEPFALAPATFSPLPVDAGSVQSLAADATTGIFYMLSSGAPEVYRTDDYGGSWRTVTLSYDDPGEGLRSTNLRNLMAVSSVSGEVAVVSDGPQTVSYSTDYGLTWRTVVGGDFRPQGWQGAPRDPVLFWGHASPGATDNVLLFAQVGGVSSGPWDVWRADMSAQAPAFVKEPSDPFGTGSLIDVVDSADGSFVGRYSASGALSFAPLTASGPIAFGPDHAIGLPTPPRILALGGAKEASAPPDGALVVGGGSPPVARMLTKGAGTSSFEGGSFSAPTDLPGCDLDTREPRGSVAPTTTGTSGAGTAQDCWVQKSGTDPLSVAGTSGGDLAYDALWGQGNFVHFERGHGAGPLKFSKLGPDGVPEHELDKRASAGSAPGSGGFALNGLTTASVNDTAYGPAGSDEQAAALGEVPVASKDGGRTMVEILPRLTEGSDAVQWWRGASGEWLVFGHGPNCSGPDRNKLSALLDWNGVTKLSAPNVSGSGCADLEGQRVFALQAVPGTDTIFIGTGDYDPSRPKALYRARLVPGNPNPSLADVFKIDAPLSNKPAAMAYCPPSSAREDMRDVLFVAAGEPYPHDLLVPSRLLRITGATSASPGVTVVDSVPHDSLNANLADVRADCGAGVVYAGGRSDSAAPAATPIHPKPLYRSEDGGQTFTPIEVPGPGLQPINELTAIGLNPADPDDVTVAAEPTGATVESTDGGVSWTVVNDPAVQRAIRVNDIEFPPEASAGSALAGATPASFLRAAQVTGLSALVGTGSGVFLGDIAATSGLIGQLGGPDTSERLSARITTLGSDGNPSLTVAPASGAPVAVFRRSNGLYYASANQGGWSVPEPVPGTTGGDDFPATALDSAGRLHVAFARAGSKAGIYATTRDTSGIWPAPRRVSSKSGDELPAIALAGKRIHVTFLRTKGAARGRGVFHVSGRGTRWSKATKVPKTAAADANAKLGGPALEARGGKLHLAFARTGRASGIYYSSTKGSKWTAPKRMTRLKGDADPAVAIDSKGAPHVVFRRTRGKPRALFALRIAKKPLLRRIAGTIPADLEPVLSVSGLNLILAFARPAGTTPGIYYDRRSAKGRWLSTPVRWSGDAGDRNPTLRADAQGRLTLVFERR
jgi:hypothetical protein